jgi:hypothetical protein
MDEQRQQRLSEFVNWTTQHITGDEKGQAQIFIDHLFQAFGRQGSLDVGGTPELRIRKAKEDGGGIAFADYVWKPVVLIEMKRRGTDLSRHYRQAFDYWTRLVPGRPHYVVLCNFDEFHVYDFDTQLDTPKDILKLSELPTRYGPLAFLFPTNEKPQFNNDREAVTREAADCLARCFNKLVTRKVERPLAQRFILQTLVALFSEDIGLLDRYTVSRLLDDIKQPSDAYDLFGGLFSAMNTPPKSAPSPGTPGEGRGEGHGQGASGVEGGRFKGVPYFNGGLFAHPARIPELYPDEVSQLSSAASKDWSKVSPEIFGELFQKSMDAEQRHAFGAHFTYPTDIMKIVKPTIVDPWTEAIEGAKSGKRLSDLQDRLSRLRILDPACGSGNFLYLAYREMKRLETRIRERLATEFPETHPRLTHVNARQFFGLDINTFAIELAKVTMTIARKLAIDELHILDEPALPLDNLDANFQARDALITPVLPVSSPAVAVGSASADAPPCQGEDRGEGTSPSPGTPGEGRGEGGAGGYIQAPWPPADVIIGNPPFLGAKRLKPERGVDYVNAVRKLYPDVPGMADYCVYWFRRAHDHLPPCTKDNPLAGRAGLVGTQNIRNNQSRVGGLDHIVKTGTIIEAVDNQPWSGEANVHVSIVDWVKSKDIALLPTKRRLWTKVAPDPTKKRAIKTPASSTAPSPSFLGKRNGSTNGNGGAQRADKIYELKARECRSINSALSDAADVAETSALRCNQQPQRVFQGNTPGHDGFLLSEDEMSRLVRRDPKSRRVISPYLIGRELLSGNGKPERWIIDFEQRDMLEAQAFAGAFDHVRRIVLPDIAGRADKEAKLNGNRASGEHESVRKNHLERWWMHWRSRQDRVDACRSLHGRYIVCSRVTKRPIFVFVTKSIRPGDALQTFIFDDDYSFGLLQSNAHWQWFITKCSKLTERFRYTPESVFDTFPWPQSPSKKQIDAVANAGCEVRRVRADALAKIKGGLRAVYRTLELPGKNPLKDAHAALDSAVLAAYNFNPKQDLLSQLLALNQQVSAAEKSGQPVTPPGVPATYGDTAPLITNDAIKP